MKTARLVLRPALALAALVVVLDLAPTPARALSYVECSAGLVDQPAWEAGNSEFEMEDVNGDGHVDLVSIGDHGNPLISSGEQGLMVWFGDGRGNWVHGHAGAFGYGGVGCGDLDGDGRMDVAYGMHHDYGSGDFGDGLLEAALGDGSGTNWMPWDDGLAAHGQTYGMFSTDLLDADGDGDLDVASASFGYGQGLHVYLNRRDGTWARSFGYLGDSSGNLLTTGDVDGDGAPDIAASLQTATAWLDDGDGFYEPADGNLPAIPEGDVRDGAALGDVDGDGRDDLAFCDESGRVRVWLARGRGQWAASGTGLPSDTTCQRTRLEDMDADGVVDLVLLGKGRLRVLRGDGGVAWSAAFDQVLPDTPGDAAALVTGRDVDHNGRPDVVLVESQRTGMFSTRNKARCYREDSPASVVSVRVTRPGPSRTLRAGSRAAIGWAAAVPPPKATTSNAAAAARAAAAAAPEAAAAPAPAATITLELSAAGTTGPWRPIAAGAPDNGQFAWTVPAVTCDDCRIRATLDAGGGATASAVGPRFSIVRRAEPLALRFTGRDTVAWQDALARPRHALYRGDWARFRATGEVTQDPAAVPGAARFCALDGASAVTDTFVPPPGGLAYYLVTATRLFDDGQQPGTPVPMAEGPLGQRSDATMRANAHPCPD